MIVIAVDPGKISGIAIWTDEKPLEIRSYEENVYDTVHILKNIVGAPMYFQNHDIVVVTERFTISERTIKTALSLDALDINGWLTCEEEFHSYDLVFQTPTQAKKFATDAKLKALDWFERTKDGHANDAARHLMVYLVDHHSAAREALIPLLAKELLK